VSGHGGGGQGGQAAAVVLSDAQIAAIVSAANAGEIAQNNVAQQKATHAQARTLATDFVDMHTMAQAQLDTLLTTLKITPEDNAITAELKQTSDTIINRLQAADEAVFDTVWLQSQIDVHIRVLELIDSMLLPNAIAPQLHDALLQTRALVSDHLARARALADTLDLDVDAGVAELDAGI
jgi:putative membrane protein